MAYNPYGEVKRDKQPPHMAPVASFEQDDHPSLTRNLLRDLREYRAKAYEGLIAAKDWPDFEKRRGAVQGLDAAIELCQQQEAKLRA